MSLEKQGGTDKYHFTLYVDPVTPRYSLVVDRLYQLCLQYLHDSYSIEVIDVREDPSVIERAHIIAVPTLSVTTPQKQTHRFVGDLSQSEMFIVALGMAQEAGKMGQLAGEMGQAAADMRGKIKSP
jgi:circadian clock protein KaiB